MMFPRPLIANPGRPVYRVDLVDTADGLGYLTTTPPRVRVIERDRCPRCADQDEWLCNLDTGDASCPCGHVWNVRTAPPATAPRAA